MGPGEPLLLSMLFYSQCCFFSLLYRIQSFLTLSLPFVPAPGEMEEEPMQSLPRGLPVRALGG